MRPVLLLFFFTGRDRAAGSHEAFQPQETFMQAPWHIPGSGWRNDVGESSIGEC